MELGINDSLGADSKAKAKQNDQPGGFFTRQRSRRSASVDTPRQVPLPKNSRRTSVTTESTGTQHISYLEAQHSQEGPPSQRFFVRLQWKVRNTPSTLDECISYHQSYRLTATLIFHRLLTGRALWMS